MKVSKRIMAFLSVFLLTLGIFAACSSGKKPDPTPQLPEPVSIAMTNESIVTPGSIYITATILPANASQAFSVSLMDEYDGIDLAGKEVVVSEDVEDGMTFQVKVTAVAKTSITEIKEFTVDNKPPEGLFLNSKVTDVDVSKNSGKHQMEYSIYPEEPVTFEILNAAEMSALGILISENGEITVDVNTDNKIPFTVRATSESGIVDELKMTVKNEIFRNISTEAELRAIWPAVINRDNEITAVQQAKIRGLNNFYRLTNDIVLSDDNFVGIGQATGAVVTPYSFNGVFDGQGYSIKNFNMGNAGWNNGMFTQLGTDGVIRRLGLIGGAIGVKGYYSAPLVGYLHGIVEHCFTDVKVEGLQQSGGDRFYMPVGSLIATIEPNSVVRYCYTIGMTSRQHDLSDRFATGFVSSARGTFTNIVSNSYALLGTVEAPEGAAKANYPGTGDAMFKNKEELQTAATYTDWNEDIWYITDGSYPTLKTPDFKTPESVIITNDSTVAVVKGSFTINASVTPSEANQSLVYKLKSTTDSNITLNGNVVNVGALTADGAKFTVVVSSLVNPAINEEIEFTVSNPPELLGVEINNQTDIADYDLSQSFQISLVKTGSTDAVAEFSIVDANGEAATVTGVSIDSQTGLVTIANNANNKAKFIVKVSLSDGENTVTDQKTFTVKSEYFREISNETELRAIWTTNDAENNARLSNNYILKADIALTSVFKPIGLYNSSDTATAFKGIFDGNGYVVSNLNMATSWNAGFFGRIAQGAIVKNLGLESGTGSNDGIRGFVAGAFTGLLDGTIINCYSKVRVYDWDNTKAQPSGSIVHTVGTGAKIENCYAIGEVVSLSTSETNSSGFIGSGSLGVVTNSFVLNTSTAAAVGAAKVLNDEVQKTYEQMQTASLYIDAGWSTDIWYIVDGAYPVLKNPDFKVPTSVEISNDNTLPVGKGSFVIGASVLPVGANQKVIYSLKSGADSNITLNGNVVNIGALTADGAKFTIVVASSINPAIKEEIEFTVSNPAEELSVEIDNDSFIADYDSSPNFQVGLNRGGSADAVAEFSIVDANGEAATVTGVSIDSQTGLVTIANNANNKAKFIVKVSLSDGENTVTDQKTFTVKSEYFREISNETELRAIWTTNDAENNARLSNNYILKADIALTSVFKPIGLYNSSDTATAFKGIFDGNGYVVSNLNMATSWNAGFFGRIAQGAIVKNLGLESGTGSSDGIRGFAAGAFTGLLDGAIINCYSKVRVYDLDGTKALPLGSIAHTVSTGSVIENCYAIGEVLSLSTNETNSSGFIGSGSVSVIKNSFVLNTSTVAAVGAAKVMNESIQKTSEQMQTASLYTEAGWSADIWTIENGAYPQLKKDIAGLNA